MLGQGQRLVRRLYGYISDLFRKREVEGGCGKELACNPWDFVGRGLGRNRCYWLLVKDADASMIRLYSNLFFAELPGRLQRQVFEAL